jgi:hypothetical protein
MSLRPFTIVCALLLQPGLLRAGEDVRLLVSDAGRLVLEFRPLYDTLRAIPAGGRLFHELRFAGATGAGEPLAGSPDLPVKALALGLPGPTGHAVRVLEADFEEIPDVVLAPVPHLAAVEEIPGVEDYRPDPATYAVDRLLPGDVARLEGVERVRSMTVGRLLISPVQFNPVRRTVQRYSRIVVEVTYGPAQGLGAPARDADLLRPALVNGGVAVRWALDPPRPFLRAVPSVLSTGDWYRLTVTADGMYRLDAAYLTSLGINIGALDPRTIRIYGGDGRMLAENPLTPRPSDLTENAIQVIGEDDGRFDAGDAVVFYGTGTTTWAYDRTARVHSHATHLYGSGNMYWLTFGGASGLRMQDLPSVSDPADVVPAHFADFALVEEERANLLGSGREWYGQSINPGSSFTHVLSVPGIVAGQPVRYRARLAARTNVLSTFTLRERADIIGAVSIVQVNLANDYQYARANQLDASIVPAVADGQSQVNAALGPSTALGSGWIDWLEVHYRRRFEPSGGALRFRSPDTAGVVEYRLEGFTSLPVVYDVSTPGAVRRITGITGTGAFRAAQTAGSVAEYWAVTAGGYRTPAGAVRMPNQNLRGLTEGADFIIITTREFRAQAERLAAHRRLPEYGGLRTVIVEPDTIYNEFSHGVPDVAAIRDFLKYAYESWTPRPEYVLFFGGASYDYRGHLGRQSSYVPTWQSQESLYDLTSYCTDDFFVKFGAGDLPWMVSGRISSRTPSEAVTVVDKLIAYDTRSARDGWSSRMLYVGDDYWVPTYPGSDGTIHSDAAEELAEVFTPREFEKRKIYLAEYPTVNTAQGRRKPGAYEALIEEINRGVLTVNFAGHGNPTVWAHESIFSITTSIPRLVNTDRLPVVYAATCNFSQFDDLSRYTGSELLLNKPDGGAIGVVSATRKVFAGANSDFHNGIFQQSFRRDVYGRLLVDRPARGMFLRKTIRNAVNDQKFFYMGDPTMRFRFPSGFAAIDSINGERVDSVNGAPRQTPVLLRALGRVTVSGTIRRADNSVDEAFTGTAAVELSDASRRTTIVAFIPPLCCDGQGNLLPQTDWPYVSAGGTLYRGQASVTNGRFRITFLVPKDIQYGDAQSRGRLQVITQAGAQSGIASTSLVTVSGTDSTAPADARGPEITVYLESRAFRPGDPVGGEPLLLVDLSDSSGINTSVAGVGHRIEAWLNEAAEARDVTAFYTGRLDDFRQGTVEVPLSGLPQGRNTLRVRAWDTYNNPSTAETYFEVSSTDELRISDVFTYPNPFRDGTEFTFRQNLRSPLTVTVKIYTVAGRLIQILDAAASGDPFVRVPWDGRDRDGDAIANGVYLYKIVATTGDGRFTSEALGRLAVVR